MKLRYLLIFILLTTTGASQVKYEVPLANLNCIKINIANSQIGIREETNKKQILNYLKSVNIKNMTAWCAAFQYWVYDEACKQAGIKNKLVRSGLANAYYNFAKKYNKKKEYKAIAGDLIVWKTDSYTGHIGLVIQNKGKQSVETIEGNTSSLSVRTGGAVEKKTRSIYHPIGKLKVRGLIGYGISR